MLLGYPSGGLIDRSTDRFNQVIYGGVFFQDDWKVNNKLTLNLGLRWEYEGAPTERDNRNVRGWDPDAELAITSAAQAAYARNPIPEVPASAFRVRGGLTFASDSDRGTYNPDMNNFQPRVGFAYQLNEKTGSAAAGRSTRCRRCSTSAASTSRASRRRPTSCRRRHRAHDPRDAGQSVAGRRGDAARREPWREYVRRTRHRPLQRPPRLPERPVDAVVGQHAARAAGAVGARGRLRGEPQLRPVDRLQPELHSAAVLSTSPSATTRSTRS